MAGHDNTIVGHPTIPLFRSDGSQIMITVCAECGEMRSVLFLTKDRWFCTRCKAEGATPPNMFPVT